MKLVSEEGGSITSPLYVGLAENGYTMLRLDAKHTYVDKGGVHHRTFEKDGVRIALAGGNSLGLHHKYPDRKPVVFHGENADVILSFIGVDRAARNQGKAHSALELISKIADERGLTIYLEPAQLDDSGLDKAKLIALYAKHRFIGKGGNLIMVRNSNIATKAESNDD